MTPTIYRCTPAFLLLLLAGMLLSCDDDKEMFVPGAPKISMDLDARTISWDSIAGTSSYNLYVKTVEDCPDIKMADFQDATKDDAKNEDVSSPFSIETFSGCTTCYYAALAAANEAGEGELSNSVGWQLKTCP